MAGRLSFSIAVNLLTENFKRGANTIKDSFRSIQMQVLAFAAALGAGSIGLMDMLSRMKDVARETNRAVTSLKNVSGSTRQFTDSLKFLNEIADKYGMGINGLISNFAKFTASATQSGMSMKDQKKIFESVSRACTAFNLSADRSDEVMVALYQMMGKGKISSEELRKQMGEKLPVAMQAMADAAGVSMAELDKLMKSGKLMSSYILPKFADALNNLIPNVDTDNLETSINRLENVFVDTVNKAGITQKYKTVVDGVTSLIKTASDNIQNIIVGVIAVIAFAVSNALTKIYRGYAATGEQIIANATIKQNKLEAATAARVEAEIALENAKAQQAIATQRQQLQAARAVAKAETTLKSRVAAESIAQSNAKLAAEQAAAIKSSGVWATASAAMIGTFRKLTIALKSMWNSFAPALIISAIVALIGYFVNVYNESKRIKNIFSDYRKELKKASGGSPEIKQLQSLQEIINNTNKSLDERKIVLHSLNGLLNTNYQIDSKTLQVNGRINDKIAEQIKLMKARSRADMLVTKLNEFDDRRKELVNKKTKIDKEDKNPYSGIKPFLRNAFKGDILIGDARNIGMDTSQKIQDEINQIDKAKADAKKELELAIKDGGLDTHSATREGGVDPTGDEKRLAALRQLDEEDRQRQIDKQRFDLEMQQKSINAMDDSFDKQIEQTKLNYKKEQLTIDEEASKLLKKQEEYAKNKYISKNGSSKGFGEYFANLKKNNFKDNKGVDVMPEGLRPEDITNRVKQLADAARKEQAKGMANINKDLSLFLSDQETVFASDLDKKLTAIDNYYNEQKIKAGTNSKLINQIESNRGRAKIGAVTDDKLKSIDFNQQLEQERLAGMESIGMTELVEQKKYEITKKYIEQRIAALKPLADTGDQEAQRQMAIWSADLKNLNLQKPVMGLSGLANKALFNTIAKGFQKMGYTAEEAQAKTIKLFSKIKNNASDAADMIGELQSAFGGLDDTVDEALQAAANIASGFAKGTADGIIAVVGEGIKLISKAFHADKANQEALKKIAEERLASQRAYNLALGEQNMLMEKYKSVFGEESMKEASGYARIYQDRENDLKTEMKGKFKPDDNLEKDLESKASSGGTSGAIASDALDAYRKKKAAYDKGIGGLADAQIVTGHKKTGLFGWGKGEDETSSILSEYDDVISKEGKLNIERIKNILETRHMSDETRAYLQNLVDLDSQAQKAKQNLENYLQDTFGSLGDDLTNAIVDAVEKGADAWEEFQKAGGKVFEKLGKQLMYELFFAEDFKNYQKKIEEIYGSDKSDEEKAKEAEEYTNNWMNGEKGKMSEAETWWKMWQDDMRKNGFDTGDDSDSQPSASKGGFETMTQDQAGALEGRFTGLYETGLRMEVLLNTISFNTSRLFGMQTTTVSELVKQTEILNNIQQIQQHVYSEIEGTGKALQSMNDKLNKLNKNTSKL